jgi:septum formation protein
LAQIGVVPETRPSDIDETPRPAELPRLYARRMAQAKLAAAARPGELVLAADTVVAVGRRILPKAAGPAEVRDCLAMLSGRRHHVITAVALQRPSGSRGERVVDTAVAFTRLTAAQIEAYVACTEGEGKAGGYAIQGRAGAFVRMLVGSYSNVVGLPLFETANLLRAAGVACP